MSFCSHLWLSLVAVLNLELLFSPVVELGDVLLSVLLAAVCNLELLHQNIDLLLKSKAEY